MELANWECPFHQRKHATRALEMLFFVPTHCCNLHEFIFSALGHPYCVDLWLYATENLVPSSLVIAVKLSLLIIPRQH